MKSLNLNHTVRVKLTEFGLKVHQEHYRAVGIEVEPRVDEKGYTIYQLWDLMNIFGQTLYMGSVNLPFYPNSLFIEDKDLDEEGA